MSIEGSKSKDYKSITPPSKPVANATGDKPLLSSVRSPKKAEPGNRSLDNLSYNYEKKPDPEERFALPGVAEMTISSASVGEATVTEANGSAAPTESNKKTKRGIRDLSLLYKDRWLIRNGHLITYIGLYLFSVLVLFRPYEIVPGLGFLVATAFYFAAATLAIYLPSQVLAESNLTVFSTEVKAILVMTFIAIATIPIAKDPGTAWERFNDPYIKAVVIFIVLVNVVRTRKRLMGLMWLSLGIAVYLSFAAMDMYMNGQFRVEAYRVAVDVGGMFGNPNEMALHLVMMTPIVIALAIASKRGVMRWIYFVMAALFVGAIMVTFSRGGFLGLVACMAVLAWKLGRKYRLNVTIASVVVLGLTILSSPENYGRRMLSIFFRGLDPAGSSDQRRELLERSILVTARNPWGIGIGNFPLVGVHNLGTHNAFTQVSTELGILGLVAYLVFMISPFRKLRAVERIQFEADDLDWFYYLAVGLQASIVGFWVSSFFASVAYNWFIYYLIAYAVAFRRIYSLEKGLKEDVKAKSLWEWPRPEAA